MSDDTNAEPEDGEETDRDESNHGNGGVDVERTVTREEAATLLHDLADGVASGSVAFENEKVTAAVPGAFEFELEYERGADVAEIDVELAWDVDTLGETGGEGVETSGDESADEAGSEDAETPDDASAVEGLVEPSDEARSRARFELYRDNAEEWRWRLVHHNGNIIADGGEGYNRKGTARNGLESVKHNAPGAAVVERE